MAKNRELYLDLSKQGAEQVARLIDQYISELETKRRLLVKELAGLGLPIIHSCMSLAEEPISQPYEAYIDFVDYDEYSRATLKLKGTEVLFVEFGAGVHFNGSTSPNPYSSKFGYEIGGYGKNQGLNDFWFYREDGELIKSHGTRATMPMYRSYATICNDFMRIVNRVFM